MINYIKYIIITLIFTLCHAYVIGQEDCIKSFQRAKRLYDQGIIDEIPEILGPCIESGFTRAQKIEAYKLIILAYLFDDNQYEAEKNMLEFLKKYPEYEVMPNDPVEFVYLFESYKTKAIISLGFTLGPNFTNPRIIEPWYAGGDDMNISYANSTGAGFHMGLNLSRYISNSFFLNVGLNYMGSRYSFMDKIAYPYKQEDLQTTETTFDEKLSRLDIPLTIAYELSSRNINFYLCAGFSVGSIYKVIGIPSKTYGEELPPVTGADIVMTDYREKLIYSSIMGTGLKFKVPRGYLVSDFRYYIGLNNIIKPESRNEITDLWSTYLYIDDDYSINSFTISIGYYLSFYKPGKQN